MDKLIRKAFTLIELLVVIAIIGILSGLIVVSMGGMTTKASIAKAQIFANSTRNSLMMNIIGEWKFDELSTAGEGTTIQNSWGGINNGTLDTYVSTVDSANKVRTGTECVSGNCLYFDGTDDYISVPSNLINISNNFTVSAWVKKIDKATDCDRIFSFVIDANNGFQLIFDCNTGKYGAFLTRAGVSTINQLTYKAYDVDKWVHVLYTMNGSTGSFYNNGVLINSDGSTSIAQGTVFNNSIACRSDSASSTYFKGYIDDVRIYDATIPTSQIKEQYYAGLNSLFANGNITSEEYLKRISLISLK